MQMNYQDIVERRRALRIEGYKTLADVGFDGPWVTPYQKASCAANGPVLVAYHWLDARSAVKHRARLDEHLYLPEIVFNRVIDLALRECGMTRSDLYLTQAFHLLPERRSASIASRDIDRSFDEVTRHELIGRPVIALGTAASSACRRHGVPHWRVPHPSARGLTHETKANELARAINATRCKASVHVDVKRWYRAT